MLKSNFKDILSYSVCASLIATNKYII
uniref:Uncharacterized protein n=1 Tax=Arundo donax TaxID=35708 RepID=A0A0A8Z0F2_ARUDO